MSSKKLLYYLLDTPTGLAWYVDSNGNIQKGSIWDDPDKIKLKNSPDGWMNTQIGYGRNETYLGLNQSYAMPVKFILDGAKIIRQQFYQGSGIEAQFTLLVFIYNTNPKANEPLWKLFYNGQLDMTKASDDVAEGVSVNLIQGGIAQLLKTYENTFFEIPCDGSIPENIKVNFDGLYLPDTFYYDIIGVGLPTGGAYIIPTSFSGQNGDNFGIIQGNQTLEQITSTGGYFNTSANFLFSSTAPITVRVKGNIVLKPYLPSYPVDINLSLVTSALADTYNPDNWHAESLIPSAQQTPAIQNIFYGDYFKSLGQETIFYFDQEITLAPNENLFLSFRTIEITDRPPVIVGGSFQISFVSKAQDTRAWAITAWDLFRLLVKKICQAASTTTQVFNYSAVSSLLQNNLNLVVTSGDALRASGDPDFQKYYNAIQINPNFPSQVNNYVYGPVIKTCLADFFKSFSAILCGAVGIERLSGQGESIFFESLGYVFNPTTDPSQLMTTGEIRDLAITPDEALFFNRLRIGYPAQSYDQKAGKYEYNTTAEWYTPLRTLQTVNSTKEIISVYRADSYGIERLRADINQTSTTRNDSDNSVFVINIDRSKTPVYDYWEGYYNSGNQVFNDVNNTNIRVIPALNIQSLPVPLINGNFLSVNNDPSIFVLNQTGSHSRTLTLNLTGILSGNVANPITGAPADAAIITLYKNGSVYQSWETVVSSTSVNTPININWSITDTFKFQDVIYVRITTTSGATVAIYGGSVLSIDGAYFTATTEGEIDILPGAYLQMIPFTLVTTTQVTINGTLRDIVSYGFQYFTYNTSQASNNYNYDIQLRGITQNNNVSDNCEIDFWYNGNILKTKNNPGTGVHGNQVAFYDDDVHSNSINGNIDLALGDILFITASNTNQNAEISYIDIKFTSTQVIAYQLMRVLYDSILGLPQEVASDQPGAPYNIEQLTPARMFIAWSAYFRSIFFNLLSSAFQFSKLDKNQFLSTTLGGVTITENSPKFISDFNPILFYPFRAKFKTVAPPNFNDLLNDSANSHILSTYNNTPIYSFPENVTQQQPLNNMQEWDVRLSPLTDLSELLDMNISGINLNQMSPNSMQCSFANSMRFVPEGQVLDPRYHTMDMNLFWFSEQVSYWLERSNYFAPRQTNEVIPLQFITKDLGQVQVQLISCNGIVIETITLTETTSLTNAIPSGYHVFEGSVSLSGVTPGYYYLYAIGGTGSTQAFMISEGLNVQYDWPRTLLLEYSDTQNKSDLIFDTGFIGSFRVHAAYDNTLQPDFVGTFYKDEMQNSQILNAIDYETFELWIGFDKGVPDWVIQKVSRILKFNQLTLDGIAFSLDEGAKLEKIATQGAPMKYWKTTIRRVENEDSISVTAAGYDPNAAMFGTMDFQYFGPNAGNMGSGTPNINEVTITP